MSINYQVVDGVAHLVIVSSNDAASGSHDISNFIYVQDNILDATTRRLLGEPFGAVIIMMFNHGFLCKVGALRSFFTDSVFIPDAGALSQITGQTHRGKRIIRTN